MKNNKLQSKKNLLFLSVLILIALTTAWLKYNYEEDKYVVGNGLEVNGLVNEQIIADENVCPLWEVINKDEYLFVDCNWFF